MANNSFRNYKVVIENEIESFILAKSAKAAKGIWLMVRRNNTRDFIILKDA